MKFVVVVGAALAVAAAQGAWAASAPKISGTYAVDFIENCQVQVSQSGGFINPGEIEHAIITAKFNLGTGQVSFAGTQLKGDGLFVQGIGHLIEPTKVKGSSPYSNTATMISAFGMVLNAVYGAESQGIAQQVFAVGIADKDNHCAINLTMTRQGN